LGYAVRFVHLSAVHLLALATLSLGCAFAASAPARAGSHDGNWSVLIVTEKGDCDKGYRYNVAVSDGRVRYIGNGAVNLDGRVAANGAVKVNIRLGDKGASASGRLLGDSGNGTWRGVGPNANCAGRWEAGRR
jgi:hypothetical protein